MGGYVYICKRCQRIKMLTKELKPVCSRCKEQMELDDSPWPGF